MPTTAQQNNLLTLKDCYALAEINYPLIKQRELLEKSKEYSVKNISKGYLPAFGIKGQATYQSGVTQLPITIPGITIPSLSRTQFLMYGEVSQSVTGVISTGQQKQLQNVNSDIQLQNLDVSLYALKDRVNQLFFGVLLIDAQYQQNELMKKDIQNGIDRVNIAIQNGVDYGSSADKLKAELLSTNQHGIELKSTRKAYTDMLTLFINKTIDDSTVFEKPLPPSLSQSINRPEIMVFESQNRSDDIQRKLITTKNIPQLQLFFQGGFGSPSPVNFLSEKLTFYYIAGIRLNWPISGLYTFGKERKLLKISKSITDAQKETFLFNTGLTLKQQNTEISKLQELIKSDDDIVALRTSVKKSASVQLEYGAISVNDFLTEVNAEDQARQNRLLHEMQLLIAFYNYQNTTGD